MSTPVSLAPASPAISLFRSEITDDPENGFDRSVQLRLISGALTHLRTSHEDLWDRIHKTRGIGTLHTGEHRGIREFKKVLGGLVRTADESIDHRRTVSFVSRSVFEKIRAAPSGKLSLSQIASKDFAHEHGVPVDAVVRIVVHPENRHVDLYSVLDALSCRALLLREQVDAIDAKFKASLPGWVKTGYGAYPAKRLPLRYLALSRYYAASPSLLSELVPMSRRAATLLADFQGLVNERDGISWLTKMEHDHTEDPIAYIPDYTFDWGRGAAADSGF